MTRFTSKFVSLVGSFTVADSVEEAFQLFSPVGEKAWVPGWDPELLHPPGVDWERGLIFRTREETGDAVWVVTHLNRTAHQVEYHRVEPGRYVAHITVRCTPTGGGRTDVSTAYEFVGLSDSGNAEIGAMSQEAYAEKMQRWAGWISDHLGRR